MTRKMVFERLEVVEIIRVKKLVVARDKIKFITKYKKRKEENKMA